LKFQPIAPPNWKGLEKEELKAVAEMAVNLLPGIG